MFNFKINPHTKVVETSNTPNSSQYIQPPAFSVTKPDIAGELRIAKHGINGETLESVIDDIYQKRKEEKTNKNKDTDKIKVETEEETVPSEKEEFDIASLHRGGM